MFVIGILFARLPEMPVTARPETQYVSRHPVYHPDVRLHSYRLARAPFDEDNSALFDSIDTIRQQLEVFSTVGLEQLVGESRAFVGVGRKAILGGLCESLPRDRIILEVVADIITDPMVRDTLVSLRKQGYMVALENPPNRALEPGESDLADFVRVNATEISEEQLSERVEALTKLSVQLLATHIDTHEQFELCNRYHFNLFEGYFFCEPHLGNVDIPTNRLAALRVLTKLRQPDISIKELERTITTDVSLSYKLLRYANSAFIGLGRTVDSINHAIRMVGMDRIQLWASLVVLSKMDDRPHELMTTAMVRGAMCERLAASGGEGPRETFFTVGLLSVLDALMDRPMTDALDQLPLSDEIRDALLHREGPTGEALSAVIAYERNRWEHVEFRGLSPATIRSQYLDSLGWARRISESLMI